MSTAKEDHHQKAFVNYLRLNKITYFATINETPWRKFLPPKIYSQMITAFKAMGMCSGVNDIHVYLPNVLLHLEFKRSTKEKQKDEQIVWENKVKQFSYCKYYVVYSYEEAIKIVEENL